MLPSMWYNIRRKMKIKVQKEEKGERGWDKWKWNLTKDKEPKGTTPIP
jgi:hypothetical protein